jgi:hypothetical protein
MSRRRDLTPTIERKEGQVEALGRSLAKAQERERELKRLIREQQRSTLTLTNELDARARTIDVLREDIDHWRAQAQGAEAARAELSQSLCQRMRAWLSTLRKEA